MRWTISRQILVGYVISLLFIIGFGYVAFHVSQDLLNSFDQRRQANLIISEAVGVLSMIQDAETGQRGYVITGSDAYLEPYNRSIREMPLALRDFKKNGVMAGLGEGQFIELQQQVDSKLAELGQTIQLRRAQGFQAAADVVGSDAGKEHMDRIRNILEDIKAAETKVYQASDLRAKADTALFNNVLLIGVPLLVIAMLVVGIVTARNISRPVVKISAAAEQIASGDLAVTISRDSSVAEVASLAKAFESMVAGLRQSADTSKRIASGDLTVEVRPQSDADVSGKAQAEMVAKLSELIEQVQRSGVQVNSSSVQIAATSKEQQSTATEMASTTTEISTTAKEMSATSTELLKAADNVNAISQQLAGLAGSGKEGLTRMEQIMKQIMEASSSITARLGEMNDKAGNIGSVVTTITKIADQTNLLSLNAAIEAEKAGEYGRGFSVVAAEIRRLADQTATSTLDIEQMVKEMLGSVSAGVMGMDKFSEEVRRSAREVTDVSRQIDQMIERVQSLAPSIESVYEGMQAQTQGSSQISEALSQLGEAARQTADTIRDSNRAVEQLNDASRGLQTAISRFKLH